MKKDYEKLIETLQRYDKSSGLKNVDIYSGDINGKYDTLYDINNKEVLDIMFSDGNIVQDDPDSRKLSNASYACIVRYKEDNGDHTEIDIDKIFIFVDEKQREEFMFKFVQKDPELYQKVFEQNNYKGNIADYTDSNEVGYKIVPSEELIKKNSDQMDNPRGGR